MKRVTSVFLMIGLVALMFQVGCESRIDTETKTYDSFEQWAKEQAVPVKTTEPGKGFEDLSVLKDIAGSAKVVAIGENIHMAHEFIQARHRLIEFFVEEMGFTAVVQETGFPESELVHQYVLGNIDEPREWTEDPDKGDTIGYTWGFGKEKEQIALVRWMRQYNQNPEHKRKINFYGMDVAHGYSSPLTALNAAWRYLDRVEPEYKNSEHKRNLRSLVEQFLGSGGGVRFVSTRKYHELPKETQNAYKAEIAWLIAHFEVNRLNFIKKTSENEYEWAYRYAIAARHLNQSTEYLYHLLKDGNWGKASQFRDYCQAQNILWALNREGTDGRVVVIAHNSHIQKYEVSNPEWSPQPYPVMGLFLQSIIGDDYVNIGFAFRRAVDNFTLYEVDGKFKLEQTDKDSIGSALSKVGLPMFLLNLHTAPKTGPVHDWLNQPRPMIAETNYIPVNIFKAWDALFYIDEISYAHR